MGGTSRQLSAVGNAPADPPLDDSLAPAWTAGASPGGGTAAAGTDMVVDMADMGTATDTGTAMAITTVLVTDTTTTSATDTVTMSATRSTT